MSASKIREKYLSDFRQSLSSKDFVSFCNYCVMKEGRLLPVFDAVLEVAPLSHEISTAFRDAIDEFLVLYNGDQEIRIGAQLLSDNLDSDALQPLMDVLRDESSHNQCLTEGEEGVVSIPSWSGKTDFNAGLLYMRRLKALQIEQFD